MFCQIDLGAEIVVSAWTSCCGSLKKVHGLESAPVVHCPWKSELVDWIIPLPVLVGGDESKETNVHRLFLGKPPLTTC